MRCLFAFLAALPLILLAAACGSDSSSSASDGGSGGASTGTASGTSTGTGTGGPVTCEDNADCEADEFCQPLGYGCNDGFDAQCLPRPTDCAGTATEPVCGCDGMVYDNGCLAAAAGVATTLYNSTCTPPAGTFACGNHFCEVDAEICVEDLEVFLECFAYPPGCDPSAPTCATCTPDDLPSNCGCSDAEAFAILCN